MPATAHTLSTMTNLVDRILCLHLIVKGSRRVLLTLQRFQTKPRQLLKEKENEKHSLRNTFVVDVKKIFI